MGLKAAVISAGHGLGSQQPGAIDPGAGGKEWQKVLWFASGVAQDLAALGIPTMLRDEGLFSKADDEAARFAKAKGSPCPFIEYHLDAGPKTATGTTSFVGTKHTPREASLAKRLVGASASTLGIKNRGVVDKDFAVVKTQYPEIDSVLHELAFISNPNDMKKYGAKVEQLELAHLNAILATYARKPATVLPRKTWRGKLRIKRYFVQT